MEEMWKWTEKGLDLLINLKVESLKYKESDKLVV